MPADDSRPPTIRAAGGVVWRSGSAGVEVVLVHRPGHNDWTLPKGKLRRGEHVIAAAVREVWEETGIRPRLGAQLPSVSYQLPARAGAEPIRKVVDYWAMTVAQDHGAPVGVEIDAVAWIELDSAAAQVSYPRDTTVLAALAALGPLDEPLILVAPAPDHAERLTDLLIHYAPTGLCSSGTLASKATLRPLAEALQRQIEVVDDAVWVEPARPNGAPAALAALGRRPGAWVYCGEGARLLARRHAAALSTRCRPAAAWVLHFAAAAPVALDHLRLA
jgi:8-oxo-dGTP diphosphatase